MKENELDFEVKKLNVKDGDTVVFFVDVGNMPTQKALDYLDGFRHKLKNSVLKDTPVLVTTKDVDLKVLSKEDVKNLPTTVKHESKRCVRTTDPSKAR